MNCHCEATGCGRGNLWVANDRDRFAEFILEQNEGLAMTDSGNRQFVNTTLTTGLLARLEKADNIQSGR